MSEKEDKMKQVLEVIEKQLKPEFFLSENDLPCMSYVREDGIRKTIILKSSLFKKFLFSFCRSKDLRLSNYWFEFLVNELEYRCFSSNLKREVFCRVGYFENDIYIDHGEYFIKISKDGYSKLANAPIPFLSLPRQAPLPVPKVIERDIFLKKFSKYFNVKNEQHLALILAFVIKLYIRNVASSLIFVFQGKQDSGKTTASEVIKFLVDPTEPLLSIPPRVAEDVVVLANTTYMLAYDNLSGLSHELADFFCSVVYGINYSKRALFTDDDEKRYCLKRDVLFNGIDDLSGRNDLNDRVVEIELKSIESQNRKSKTLLNRELEEERPYFLHGLYSLLSDVLRVLPTIRETNLPRMADYVRIGLAIDSVIGYESENFIQIYNQIVQEKKENSFWNDDLCCAIFSKLNPLRKSSGWQDEKEEWRFDEKKPLIGNASELLDKLFPNDKEKRTIRPFKSLKSFSNHLKRIEPLLKQKGILVERLPRNALRRDIKIFIEDNTLAELRKCENPDEYLGFSSSAEEIDL